MDKEIINAACRVIVFIFEGVSWIEIKSLLSSVVPVWFFNLKGLIGNDLSLLIGFLVLFLIS
jgi:hypothetical protein